MDLGKTQLNKDILTLKTRQQQQQKEGEKSEEQDLQTADEENTSKAWKQWFTIQSVS